MSSLKRYAAKLLFYYDVESDADAASTKTCEVRIVVMKSENAISALSNTKERAKCMEWENNQPDKVVRLRFVGILDFISLESVTEDEDEVWYEIFEKDRDFMLESLLPNEKQLDAVLAEDELAENTSR